MSATPAQQELLIILDELALLTGIDEIMQVVVERIENRGRTQNEADDVKLLKGCRRRLAKYKAFVASHHPDGRRGAVEDGHGH